MTPGQRGPEWGCYLGGETVEALFLGTCGDGASHVLRRVHRRGRRGRRSFIAAVAL